MCTPGIPDPCGALGVSGPSQDLGSQKVRQHMLSEPLIADELLAPSVTHGWKRAGSFAEDTSLQCSAFGAHRSSLLSHSRKCGVTVFCPSMSTSAFSGAPALLWLGSE